MRMGDAAIATKAEFEESERIRAKLERSLAKKRIKIKEKRIEACDLKRELYLARRRLAAYENPDVTRTRCQAT